MHNFDFKNMPTPFLRPRAAAEFLGYTVKTLASYRSRGLGPKFVKQGARVMYPKEELIAFRNKNLVLKTGTHDSGQTFQDEIIE